MLSIDGLVTGLDTTTIIDGLLQVQQAQVDRLTARRERVTEQQSAFKSVEAALLTLRGSLVRLSGSSGSPFSQRQVASSNEEVLEASVSSRAATGTFHFRISRLARAHQVVSQPFESSTSEVAQGDYRITSVSGEVLEVSLDDSNNTVEALAEAINKQQKQVSAAVVNVGSGSRLLLSAKATGVSAQFNVTVDLAEGASPDAMPVFDQDTPVQAGQDAEIVLGSGDGAIAVTSQTNQLDNVIPGVTMNLLQTSPDQEVTLTIAQDVDTAREAIEDFVASFNETMDFIDEQQQFDPETGESSVLFGNRSLTTIKDNLLRRVTSAIPTESRANRLSAIGVRIDATGRLTIRTSQLEDALNGRIEDVSLDDIQKLFGQSGESDVASVQFVGAGGKTVPTRVITVDGKRQSVPYGVEIVQAATQARVQGSYALADFVAIGSGNNQLQLKVDGLNSETMLLADGLYSREELAEHLQTVIGSDATIGKRGLQVSLEGQTLELISTTFGTRSEVTVLGGSALSTLGLVGSETSVGGDVIGRYIIPDGEGEIVEQASGNGQTLIGNSGNRFTEDLQVRVTYSATDVQEPVRSNLTYQRGVAAELNQELNDILDLQSGPLRYTNDVFVEQIELINGSIDRMNVQFEARRESLLNQFAQLESTVSELQSAGSFLSAQLASLPQIRTAR